MPWSGCRLQFSDDEQVEDIFFHLDELNWRQLGPMTSSDLQNFLDKFGTRILNLSLGGNVLANNNIFPLLKGTPNLEVFKYNSFLPSRDMNIPELIIPLHKLQYLEYFLFTPEDVTLLEFLLTAAPCIKAVKIKFGIEWTGCSGAIEEASRLVKLISGIPSISFEADTDELDAWDPTALKHFTDLKLTELDFCVPCEWQSGRVGEVEEYYRVFEMVLWSSAECLQSLNIRVTKPSNEEMNDRFSPGYPRLKIPALPKLKRLGLYRDESIPRRNNLCSQLEPFTSKQFPSLETLVVWEDTRTHHVFRLAHFDSVSELIVSGGSANPNPMGPIWHQICPNAKGRAGVRSQPTPEEDRLPLREDFVNLYDALERKGLFLPVYLYNFLRVLETVGIGLLGCFCLFSGSYVVKFFGVVLIALAQWRSAWMHHESCHPSLPGKPKAGRCLHDVIFGIGLCLSSTWWPGGHNRHHAMPQGLKHDVDLDTLPNAKVVTNGKQGKPFLIQNQAYLLLGTLAWQFYLHPRHVIKHGYYLHLFWMTLHYVLAWQIGFWPWLLSTWLMSIYLFGNFALSHSHLPVTEEAAHWVEYSLRHTADVSPTPVIVNWTMGYLNFQIEHHLFPTIPHFRLPRIRHRVRALAEKHNLPYVIYSFPEAVQKIFQSGIVSYQLQHS